jgi:hypothetical protein
VHGEVTCRVGIVRAEARCGQSVRMEWRHQRSMDRQGGQVEGQLGSGEGVAAGASRSPLDNVGVQSLSPFRGKCIGTEE